MKRFAALVIGAALLLPMPVLYAGQEDCFKILSEDDLVCRAEYCPGVFDAGDSVRFRMAPGISERKLMGPPVTWMNITVLDGDRPVLDLPDSFYIGYSLLAQGDVRYWMIGEYTGGMHCCARYHFFSRPAPEHTLRYLGANGGQRTGYRRGALLVPRRHSFPAGLGHPLPLFPHALCAVAAAVSHALPVDPFLPLDR